jgi:hypothetical protein
MPKQSHREQILKASFHMISFASLRRLQQLYRLRQLDIEQDWQ